MNSTLKLASIIIFTGCAIAIQSNRVVADSDLGAYIMLDANQTGAFYDKKNEEQNSLEIRRAGLAIKSNFNDSFSSKLQLQYSSDLQEKENENEAELKDYISDAYLTFDFSGLIDTKSQFKLRLGKMKQVGSLERMSSSKHLNTLERSMISQSFYSGRSTGLRLYRNKKMSGWDAALFTDEEDDTQSLQGRYYQNWLMQNSTKATTSSYGLSFNFNHTELNDQITQVKSRGEINTADNIINSARFYATQQQTASLDTLINHQHWRGFANYTLSQLTQTGGETWIYQGGFLQLSYAFNQTYGLGKGKLKAIKHGWEWVSRISLLDLTAHDSASNTQTGSQASIVMLGLNYHQSFPSKQKIKYMVNVLFPQISGQVNSTDQSGIGVSARMQYEF